MLRMAAAPCVHMSSKIDELKSVRSSLKPLKTKQHGIGILHDPLWNKGMAMDLPERDRLNLRGLVPPRVKTLKEQADRLRDQLGTGVVALFADRGKKVQILVAATKDIAGSKVHAGKILGAVAPLVDGRGGGRPDMAQGGGSNAAGIPAALEKVVEVAREQLS